MDFIAALRMTNARDGIQIQPLRLYMSQPVAKYDGKVAVSIAMKGNAVWQDGTAGRSVVVFELDVLTQSINLAGTPADRVKYPYAEQKIILNAVDDWPKVAVWPMVPWSSKLGADEDRGNLNYEVTVAEVGKVPTELKVIADIISKNKSKLGGQLEKAVGELLAEDE